MPTLAEASLTDSERRAVDRFVSALRRELGANLLAVWLYGSRARGEARGADSDVDLLVITREPIEDPFLVGRHAVGAELAGGDSIVDLMPVAWTLDHLESRRAIRSFFVQEVDRDRVVVHGSEL